jgi:hypothetical protein
MDLTGSWDYIVSIARSRLAHNKTIRHVDHYGEEIEVLGVAGELVARRFLGLPEKMHYWFDNGTDLIFGGVQIDVKTTQLTRKISFRYLQWPVWKEVKAPIVLMAAVQMKYKYGTVLGYALREEILSAKMNTTRFTPCHEIPVVDLHQPYELFERRLKH